MHARAVDLAIQFKIWSIIRQIVLKICGLKNAAARKTIAIIPKTNFIIKIPLPAPFRMPCLSDNLHRGHPLMGHHFLRKIRNADDGEIPLRI